MDKVEGCRQGGEHLKKVDPLCNSSSPALPPASVVSLQVSLSLTLTDYASLSLKAHYLVSPSLYLILPLSLSLYNPHHLLPPFSVFQQIVFSSLLLELQHDAFLVPSPSL